MANWSHRTGEQQGREGQNYLEAGRTEEKDFVGGFAARKYSRRKDEAGKSEKAEAEATRKRRKGAKSFRKQVLQERKTI